MKIDTIVFIWFSFVWIGLIILVIKLDVIGIILSLQLIIALALYLLTNKELHQIKRKGNKK